MTVWKVAGGVTAGILIAVFVLSLLGDLAVYLNCYANDGRMIHFNDGFSYCSYTFGR